MGNYFLNINKQEKQNKHFMKRKLLILAVVSVALLSFVAEKFIVVRMPEEKMNYHWQNLSGIKQIVGNSDLPHRQVVYIVQSIDSLQRDIQASASLDSTSQTSKK